MLHTGWDKFARDLHLEPGCQLTFLVRGDEMIVKCCLAATWRHPSGLIAAWLVGTTPSGILHLMVLVAANTSGLGILLRPKEVPIVVRL
ncbi:hypothetical protein QYE76_063781 [Lolium multiflorum]|uniref:Uncharacterized protein n=1 Tax=Lolium multiflorum TaxID=4521 RepID=A0AAD8W6Y6_LOLMU|nr:hypothetical protein QYE76_063781 [Lolium multiflorum]